MSRPRIGRGTAVAAVAGLGLLLFVLTLPVWARATATTTIGPSEVAVRGSVAAPGAASAALVVVVAGLVLALSGRLSRVLAVIGVIAGGALAGYAAATFLADPAPALQQAAAEITGVDRVDDGASVTVLPVLALVVAVLLVVVGIGLPFLAGTWGRVGRRYEVGAAAPEPSSSTPRSGRTRAMDDWDSLSRGDDPTIDDPGTPESRD